MLRAVTSVMGSQAPSARTLPVDATGLKADATTLDALARLQLGALARDPGSDPPAQDVVATLEPHVERRHRLGGVLADQRGERLHVVVLEGLHVALEHLALALVQRGRRIARLDRAPLER